MNPTISVSATTPKQFCVLVVQNGFKSLQRNRSLGFIMFSNTFQSEGADSAKDVSTKFGRNFLGIMVT